MTAIAQPQTLGDLLKEKLGDKLSSIAAPKDESAEAEAEAAPAADAAEVQEQQSEE